MKRHGGLFHEISSFQGLLAASRKTRRGKRFRDSTAAFEFNLEREIIRLERELTGKTYSPGSYREFYIYEHKKRKISAAPYRDRVVQHALCAVIEPILDRSLIYDTYACRAGKGTHKAVGRFTKFARKFQYALKFDIEKYFPSIDHEILKAKIRRKIKCKDTLWLIDLFIDSSNPQEGPVRYFAEDNLFTPYQRRRGIPIGNLTSQIFANYYLSGLDHFMAERYSRFGYLRYMDDMTMFGNDKGELWEAHRAAEKYLGAERLRLKSGASMLYPVEQGVNYLGYKVFPDHRLVRYETVVRYRRRLKRLQRGYFTGKLALSDVRASAQSWIGHVKHADSWRLRERLFKEIRFTRGVV